jgi:O-antigen/teichoic acid export membrane protein
VRYSAVNYLSTLGYQAPYFALPVIVLANVTARVNASFYVAWGIVAVAFYVPSAIGQALLAEGGKDGVNVETQLRLAMLLAGGLMLLGTVATFVGSSLVTVVYGAQYRDAARILPAMMAAGIPWAITSLYLTEARVLHRHVSTVVITLTLTVAIVIPALVLVPEDGIYGARDAWVIGNVIAAVVAITAHAIGVQRMRSGRQREVVDSVAVVPRSPVSPV